VWEPIGVEPVARGQGSDAAQKRIGDAMIEWAEAADGSWRRPLCNATQFPDMYNCSYMVWHGMVW